MSFSGPDVLAAVTAADTWVDDNQTSFNTALPAAFQSGATATQKTLLLCAVMLMRVGVSFLRKAFGRVD
jgi:cytochrome c biogenesis protein ResB